MEASLTASQLRRMCEVREFAQGPYGFLLPDQTLSYYQTKYIANLKLYCDISRNMLVDCACGHGWVALAFALAGGKVAIGIDTDIIKLRIAREFAKILEVDDRVFFCRGSLTALPVACDSVDIFTCIETLEHLFGGGDRALAEMRRVTRETVVITTPNRLFPIVAHDTRLPFAHWMNARVRRVYAKCFGRQDDDVGNTFLTPFQVRRGLSGFRLVSKFLGFASFESFVGSYPHYLPYIGAGHERDLPKGRRILYMLLSRLLGGKSFYALPSIAGVFKRGDRS